MRDELLLINDAASVGVLPGLGAAMSRYEYLAGRQRRQLLTSPDGRVNLVMAPWQNRISGGGYTFEGQRVDLAPTVPDADPYPLHGNAWLQPWKVLDRTAETATLQLVSNGPGRYSYRAEMSYILGADGSLETALTVINAGPTLPFGLGFHPYFTRTADVRLQAAARTVTLQDARHLPTETVPASSRPDWDFTLSRPIPKGPINNEFGGWNGVADVSWPDWGIGCRIQSPKLTRYLVYSPGNDAAFFCFEPITHTIDAFNQPDPIAKGGLIVLRESEGLTLRTTFQPHDL